MILGNMNRAEGGARRLLNLLYLYIGSMLLVSMQVTTMEYSFRIQQHTGAFYVAMSIAVPLVLMGVAAGSEHRWGATIVAGIYTAFMLGLIWILPRFAAEPKLGPVYNPVTQFVPPQFPLLLIVPALVIDLLRQYFQRRGSNVWLQAAACGAAFFGLFFAVQWLFADFLMTPAAANAFFGTIYRDYGSGPGSFEAKNLFVNPENNFTMLLWIAFGVSVAAARIAFAAGSWMRTVKR
jgi:hypothetical protein